MNHFLQSNVDRTTRVFAVLVMFFFTVSISAFAQGTVSGKITDDTGEGLPGVTVLVEGTSTGTVTDIEGNYNLAAASDAVLKISYIGFKTQTIPVNGRSTINVQLEVDVSELSEVVVIGYGSVRKSDITGSVSSVKAKELQAFPVLNAAQALQGRAAGVQVTIRKRRRARCTFGH